MPRYYFTFSTRHPLSDNWIEVIASNVKAARDKMFELLGDKWGFQYDDTNWDPSYFPGGRAGRVLEVD